MKSLINLLFVILFTFTLNAQVGIGTTTPEAALDVFSTTDGLLIPRVALVNTTTVTVNTPIASELVYNTTPASGTTDVSPGFYYLSAPGGPWVRLGDASSPPPPPPPPVDSWLIAGNDDIVEGTNFLGTITGTNVDVVFRRNGIEAGRLSTHNTSFGAGALPTNNASAWNTAVGTDALGSLTGGQRNVAIGHKALESVTGQRYNVAIGYTALQDNIGEWNTAIGHEALKDISDGAAQYNVAIGHQAMDLATGVSNYNVAIGSGALRNVDGGTQNTVVGSDAGTGIIGGDNNIVIGHGAQVPDGTLNGQIQIGNAAATTFAGTYVAWSASSDRRFKDNIKGSRLGLNFIQTLRPVSYSRKNDKRKRTEYGFIAQEVEEALLKVGDSNNGIITIGEDGMYSVRYNDFIPMTVKAIQEQQALIEKLQKDNEELKAVNAAILKRLEALENK